MRSLLRKNKYNVYLVDEFRTSCKCSNCDGGVCEKYMIRKNPRPKPKKNKDNPIKKENTMKCGWFTGYCAVRAVVVSGIETAIVHQTSTR